MRAILTTFGQHVVDVDRLIEFDKEVMHVAISALEDLHERLVKSQRITNEHLNGARVLKILKGIRDHDSLKTRYSLILNQAIVLLVSYFASAMEDIFILAVTAILQGRAAARLLKEELRLTVAELKEATANPEDAVVPLFIEKKDLSFQDMQTIHRAFRDYVGVEMERDATVNDIILAQACRHVIVHAGGDVTPRFLRQVSVAFPRNLKTKVAESSAIQFSHAEVKIVAQSMTEYLTKLVRKTEGALDLTVRTPE